jgi:hypothetical protein
LTNTKKEVGVQEVNNNEGVVETMENKTLETDVVENKQEGMKDKAVKETGKKQTKTTGVKKVSVKSKANKKEKEKEQEKNIEEHIENKEQQEKTEFVRKTRLEKLRIEKTVKWLFKNRDNLDFSLAIQRNEVWTDEQKSKLIHSIIYGYPIPAMYALEAEDGTLKFLDGKQRSTAIIGFLNGDYALSKNTPPVYDEDIAGKYFAELDEKMKEYIYDELLTIIVLKHMENEEIDEMFVRLNSGTPLSKMELTRAMHSDLIQQINMIQEMPYFDEDISLTQKAKDRFINQEIILQIAMLLEEGVENIKGFGADHIREFVLKLKEEDRVLSDELFNVFETTSDYLHKSFSYFETSEKKKALKRLNAPIIFYVAHKVAIPNKVTNLMFAEFIRSFFIHNYSTSSNYGKSCKSSTSKKENVKIRINELTESLEIFIGVLKEGHNVQKTLEIFNSMLRDRIEKQEIENSKSNLPEEVEVK